MVNLDKADTRRLVYEGSVKRLWQAPGENGLLWFEFTDDYSIFDWGKMPDTIADKGRSLALLGAYFFDTLASGNFWQELSTALESENKQINQDFLASRLHHPVMKALADKGLDHHFKALREESGALFMEVMEAEVLSPEHRIIAGRDLYFYPQLPERRPLRRLVPLEVVFRFGMPEGSSLIERLEADPDYALSLGLAQRPEPGQWFDRPVIEFFTKLEPSDRHLQYQEAAQMSALCPESFETLLELTWDLALALHHIFASCNIELWDGKFEFVAEHGEDGSTRLLLADSIGPDELRLLYKGKHLSKELVRRLYKGTPWELAVREAKKLAKKSPERSFKERCLKDLGQSPQPLSKKEKDLVDRLYPVLANTLKGSEVFAGKGDLDSLVTTLTELENERTGA
ncbi:MAG: phosphoribosylaminoimidazolesuccinocarboxamide synthase [Candidatus Obscuribacterales bacterium]